MTFQTLDPSRVNARRTRFRRARRSFSIWSCLSLEMEKCSTNREDDESLLSSTLQVASLLLSSRRPSSSINKCFWPLAMHQAQILDCKAWLVTTWDIFNSRRDMGHVECSCNHSIMASRSKLYPWIVTDGWIMISFVIGQMKWSGIVMVVVVVAVESCMVFFFLANYVWAALFLVVGQKFLWEKPELQFVSLFNHLLHE